MYKENITAIELLVTNYFEGIFYGDIKKLQSCFHNNAPIYGDIKGADYFKNAEAYIEGVANRQSPNDLKESFNMKIVGVDILGKVAMAKLHVPMLGYNYYDYLSLTKIENEWKIVAKVFTHVE
ncbi:nuclear transport factor 2 family protein [Tenacibaculum sp.]|uniref:nuclear transport factor 2 family protein n=1 Tax=Tenacibaculum sp. TaxID=1906242 RepID=UPI003AA89A3F